MRGRDRWEWFFWKTDGEDEVIIYSPGAYTSTRDDYFVVVLFRTESRDWWLCKFEENEGGELSYIRVGNYKNQLREALVTCHGLNKLLGAY
jgi:hypothetical protein